MRVTGLYGWVAHNNARSAAFLLFFALLTQPMAMVVLFVPLVYVDWTHAPWYDWQGYATRYAPLVAAGSIAYLLMQMRRHVKSVRADVAFRCVDRAAEPRLVGLAEPLAILAGWEMPRLAVVETSAMNAFACGISRASAVVVVTRGLLEGLDDDELSAVIAHELIHVRNGDTRLIAAANVFMDSMTLLSRVNVFKPRRYCQIATLLVAPVLFPVYLGVAVLAQLCLRLGYASRLLISSAREFVADAEAIRLTQDPAALVSALRRVEGRGRIAGLPFALDAMMLEGAGTGLFATHPAVAARIEAIVATTGAMALDARLRRDTRSDAERLAGADVGAGNGWTPNEARRLAGIAVRAAAPRQSTREAFLRVGEGGQLSVFGLRWDMAAAMLATFCTALLLHHGDLVGFMSRMGHTLDRPDDHTRALLQQATACRNASFKQLTGSGAHDAADVCSPSAAWSAHAAALGLHFLNDGRILNESQIAMLSPQEVAEANAQPFDSAPLLHGVRKRPATDLASSYPLPLHEAWLRLAGGDLRRYLRSSQCGVLIHALTSSEVDREVTWSIVSEGEERVRFTAKLAPIDAAATHVTLEVEDKQPTMRIFDADRKDESGRLVQDHVGEPVVIRPALAAPLRPTFTEAMSAMLERRLFRGDLVSNDDAYLPGDGMTGGLCMNQRGQLESTSTPLSIHDTSL